MKGELSGYEKKTLAKTQGRRDGIDNTSVSMSMSEGLTARRARSRTLTAVLELPFFVCCQFSFFLWYVMTVTEARVEIQNI
jgi:hypothetical protein